MGTMVDRPLVLFHKFLFHSFYRFFSAAVLLLWWAQVDSNHRPHAYQACALTTWAMRPSQKCLMAFLRLASSGFEFQRNSICFANRRTSAVCSALPKLLASLLWCFCSFLNLLPFAVPDVFDNRFFLLLVSCILLLRWWRWGGSNSWPPACKAGALPAELHPQIK